MIDQQLYDFQETLTCSVVERSAPTNVNKQISQTVCPHYDSPPGILDIRQCPVVQEAGDHLGVVVKAGHMQARDPVLALVTHFVPLLQ